jgi:DNA-binding NtrC family response regulator
MEQLNVVLYQNDAATAERLAASLSRYFPSVYQIHNREEIRPTIAKSAAELLVLDVETSGTEEVERLHQEFPGLYIVCTHRLASDELWTEALSQGAADMCVPWDTEDVVRSLTREHARRAAA